MTKDPEILVNRLGEEKLQEIVERVLQESIKSAVLYGMEAVLDNLTDEDEAVGTCTCLTPITRDTLHRGYCRNCSQPITLKVGGDGL